jgi:hypothetical protein
MTVNTQPRLIDYSGNGVTKTHAVPFRFLTAGELAVSRISGGVETALSLGADYSVAGANVDAGGSITTAAATAGGTVLRIRGNTKRYQPTDYTANDTFPAESHEQALDRQAMVSQELAGHIVEFGNRALLVPPGETIATLPTKTSRAGKIFAWLAGTGSATALSAAELANMLLASLVAILPSNFKGDPGGNVMAVGSFASMSALNIPLGTDAVRTSCHTWKGVGDAFYLENTALTDADVAAQPRCIAKTANGRFFQLAPMQRLTIEMFGGRGNWGPGAGEGTIPGVITGAETDNLPALDAYDSYARFHFESSYRHMVPTLHLGAAGYFVSAEWEPRSKIHLKGVGGPGSGINVGTVLKWPAGTRGITINGHDTGLGGQITWGSDEGGAASGSCIEGIYFLGSGGARNDALHGLWNRATAFVYDCTFDSWPGAGMYCSGDYGAAGANRGGTNESHFRRLEFRACKGFASCWTATEPAAADSNASTYDSIRVKDAYGIGIFDGSRYGNTYINPALDGSGEVRDAAEGRGRCWHNGIVYKLAAHISLNVEPGTDAAADHWIPVGAVAAAEPYWPAWSSLVTYNSGAGMIVYGNSNASVICGGYSESLLVSTFGSKCITIGGTFGPFFNMPQLYVDQNLGGGLGNTQGLFSRRNHAAPSKKAIHGDTSYAGMGVDKGSYTLAFFHGDTKYPVDDMNYYRTAGGWVYDNGTPNVGGGGYAYRLAARTTTWSFGRHAGVPFAFAPARLVMTDPSNIGGSLADMRLGPGIAAGPPTSGSRARGEIIFNLNATAGGKVGWVCTQTGAIAAGAWAAGQTYELGDTRTSDGGKTYVATKKGVSYAAPTGTGAAIIDENPATPGAGVVWTYVAVPFVYKAFGVIDA